MYKWIKISRWVVGIFFLIGFLSFITQSIVASLSSLVIGLIALPLTSKLLSNFFRKNDILKKNKNPEQAIKIGKWSIALLAFIIMLSNSPKDSNANNSNQQEITPTIKQVAQKNKSVSPAIIKPTNTPTPTDTPVPTDANGFPANAQEVTVADLAKTPTTYNGENIVFDCTVASFPKDNSGNAAGINCTDPNDYSSLVQIDASAFDLTKINTGDSIRVYGNGQGSSSGKNAFGADVTESLVLGIYVNDFTSGYNDAK